MTPIKLVGTWQLVSFTATTGDKIGFPLGDRPGGYVGITSNRFWVMLVDSTRKPPASAAFTDAEAVALMRSSAAYTGKHTIDPAGEKITIHVDAASNQAITGTDRVFFFHVDGNRLTLKSPAAVVAATGLTSVVQLEFAKVD